MAFIQLKAVVKWILKVSGIQKISSYFLKQNKGLGLIFFLISSFTLKMYSKNKYMIVCYRLYSIYNFIELYDEIVAWCKWFEIVKLLYINFSCKNDIFCLWMYAQSFCHFTCLPTIVLDITRWASKIFANFGKDFITM